ncbi:MBOAT family O-acyltransferase [Leptolyngbya sp. PCC 6406]|uniref:MBOAT family O-acyltransferase n=1 Tax=Leptolyngbya sp. PCC 6406 TaxID=1173264 RepID=UPI0002AD19F2|nr:MBOAT family protein [Leptolyngbya sp. PCC 6406]
MILPSITYGLFLISVVGLYWAVGRRSLRIPLLAIASLVFYTSLQVEYVPLMLALVVVNFFWGQVLVTPMDWRIPNEQWQVAEQGWNRRRRLLLGLGIGVNGLILIAFKYADTWLGWILPQAWLTPDTITGEPPGWLAIALPLGLSFFTFECIAYLVDVYRGAPATGNFLEFTAYKLFFPKLISGPITRFHAFTHQLKDSPTLDWNWVVEGLWLIAVGSVKKLLIADHIGVLVNLSLGNLERAGSGDLWLALFAYGFQLYLDFSGYVDIARGSALLMGINLPQNFNFPYFTTSIADFWRRWHMTLGDWLRNYLYFPLGGSRVGLARTCLNLIFVMAIAGVWHGDTWGFLIWGGIHGLALAIHRLNHGVTKRVPLLQGFWKNPLGILVSWGLTQAVVFFSWLFFRLPEPRQYALALQKLWGVPSDAQFTQQVYGESLGLSVPQLWGLLGLVAVAMGIAYGIQRGLKLQISWPLKLLLVPLCLFAAWILAPTESLPYIYFEF